MKQTGQAGRIVVIARGLTAAAWLVWCPLAGRADSPTTVWGGGASALWTNGANWSAGAPGALTGAVFNSTFGNQPSLTASTATLGLWLQTGVGQDVTLNAATPVMLTLQAGVTNNGLFGGSGFAGGAALLMDDTFNHNLTVGPNITLQPQNSTTIYANNAGTLTIQGTLNNANGSGVILQSTNPASVINITGQLSGANGGTIGFNTAGVAILSGSSPAYAKNASLYGGTLRITGADALKNASLSLIQNAVGTLQLRNDTNNVMFLSGAPVNYSSSSCTVDVNRLDPINGTASNNTLWLSAVNPGNGITVNVTGGNGYSLSISNITVGNGFPQTETLNPISARLTVGGTVTAPPQSTGAQAVTLGGTSPSNAVTGSIVNPPTGGYCMQLNKSTANTWTLSGSNGLTGPIAINNGTLIATHNAALGFGGAARLADAGVVTIDGAGAILNLSGVTVNKPITLGGLSAKGSLINANTNASSTLNNGVASVMFINAGVGFVGADVGKPLTISGGGGSGAGAVITALSANTNTFTASGGTGWVSGNTITLIGGGAIQSAVYLVAASAAGAITNLTLPNGYASGTATGAYGPGFGYTSIPTNYVGGKGTASPAFAGSGATTAIAENFSVVAVAMTNAGSGYTTAPAVSVTGVSGSGFVAYASPSVLGLSVSTSAAGQLGGDGSLLINAAVTGGWVSATLTKIGSGVLTLAASNTYASATIVSNGTLSVVNTTGSGTGSGTLTIISNATLAGSGLIVPGGQTGIQVALTNGAHLSPHVGTGASTATLHVNLGTNATANALNLSGGTILDFNFGAPGTCDTLSVAGKATLGAGTNVLNIGQLAGFGAGTYTLINLTSGTLTYSVNNWTLPVSTHWKYAVNHTATAVTLSVIDSARATAVFVR